MSNSDATSSGRAAGPTPSSARLPILDVLRGIALFGIFTLNLAVFSGFIFMSPDEMAALPSAPLDLPAIVVIVWFGYGKFYSLFSLLFGIGFAMTVEDLTAACEQMRPHPAPLVAQPFGPASERGGRPEGCAGVLGPRMACFASSGRS